MKYAYIKTQKTSKVVSRRSYPILKPRSQSERMNYQKDTGYQTDTCYQKDTGYQTDTESQTDTDTKSKKRRCFKKWTSSSVTVPKDDDWVYLVVNSWKEYGTVQLASQLDAKTECTAN